ncbi:MAG: NCS2 family permease [Candidatus Aminicenantes bacterium]|nr:NCS2 family permease [Candidatus Aminicenantes bacterium]
MKSWLNRHFKLEENKTSVRAELLGGATTFMTMSYIIFVQPAILSTTGMDKGAVMFATCVSSAIATLLMGILAKYPIALAPGMGHNVFFSVIVCGIMGYSWQVALGAVFISGSLFLILSLAGVWKSLVAAVPESLKHSIAVGIGILIAFIGLQYGGLVVNAPPPLPGTTDILVILGDLTSKPVLLTVCGVGLTAVLMAMRVRGAILIGILATALLGIPLKVVAYHGMLAAPPSVLPTFLKLDILGALKTGLISVIFIFFFLDLFDTIGTLIGVSGPVGFLKDGKLPRADKAMFSDAVGTISGALLGTSTVTSYIESASGISQGARTGLANVFTSFLFMIALFFSPLAEMISGSYTYNGMVLRPVIAPPLIIVGYLMMRGVVYIKWDDLTEAIPSFLTIILMPLTFSITEGIVFGFISFSLLKLVSGKGRQVHWIIYFFSALFIIRYIIM